MCLLKALAETSAAEVEAVLSAFAADAGEAPLKVRQAEIDRLFAADTVEAILAGLDDGDWAGKILAALPAGRRPGLKIFLRQMDMGGAEFDLDAALVLEFRLSQHVMAGHDFYEGVRALIIDPRSEAANGNPGRWPTSTTGVVDRYFASLGDWELTFRLIRGSFRRAATKQSLPGSRYGGVRSRCTGWVEQSRNPWAGLIAWAP